MVGGCVRWVFKVGVSDECVNEYIVLIHTHVMFLVQTCTYIQTVSGWVCNVCICLRAQLCIRTYV